MMEPRIPGTTARRPPWLAAPVAMLLVLLLAPAVAADHLTDLLTTLNSEMADRDDAATAATPSAVFVLGGLQCAPACVGQRSILRYDLERDRVSEAGATLPAFAVSASAAALGEAVYLFGGTDQDGTRADILVYDTIADEVRVANATLPGPRAWVTAASLDDAVYVIGGLAWEGPDCWARPAAGAAGLDAFGVECNEILRYGPAEDRLDRTGVRLPEGRVVLGATAARHRLFLVADPDGDIIGGPRGSPRELWEYDPANATLRDLQVQVPDDPWNEPHDFVGVFSDGNDVYVGAQGSYPSSGFRSDGWAPTLRFFRLDVANRSAVLMSTPIPSDRVDLAFPFERVSMLWAGTGAALLAPGEGIKLYAAARDSTLPWGPPLAPENVTAFGGPGRHNVTVQWDRARSPGIHPGFYEVFARRVPGATPDDPREAGLISDARMPSVLSADDRVYVRVRAVNEAGPGPWSEEVSADPDAIPVQAPPLPGPDASRHRLLLAGVLAALAALVAGASAARPARRAVEVGLRRAAGFFVTARTPGRAALATLSMVTVVALTVPAILLLGAGVGAVVWNTADPSVGECADLERTAWDEAERAYGTAMYALAWWIDENVGAPCALASAASAGVWYVPAEVLVAWWLGFLAAIPGGMLGARRARRHRAALDREARDRVVRLDELFARGGLAEPLFRHTRERLLALSTEDLPGDRARDRAFVMRGAFVGGLVAWVLAGVVVASRTVTFSGARADSMGPLVAFLTFAAAIAPAVPLFVARGGVMSEARRARSAARELEDLWQQAITASRASEQVPRPGPRAQERFRVDRELGHGSFGRALLAHDNRLDRKVVLKQPLAAWLVNDERERRRFLQEARLAARIQHPNLVTVYEVLPDEEPPLLVLEYVPGGSVEDLLEARGKLAPREAVRLCLDALAGIERVHGAGMVHRDLKPANLLVGADGQAKVTDFGIAAPPPDYAATAAVGGASMAGAGSPAYMSPEQARAEDVDARTDLYAIGAILYRALTGRHYIDLRGLSQAEVRRRIEQADPDLSAADVPAALVPVLRRALAKAREDRFPDARQMAAALNAWLQTDGR